MPYRSVNPATGEVLKTFTEHSDQEMMKALATSDKAFVMAVPAHLGSSKRFLIISPLRTANGIRLSSFITP